jgi:phosphoglycolate phosphatase-like HAD superfamily hydrolase
VKSVLFDFEGTIIHSSELIYGGLTYIARRYAGKELSIQELNMLVGKSLRQQMNY